MVLADATKKDYDAVIKVSVPTVEEVPTVASPDNQTETALPGNTSKDSQ
jgi:hypothetical protein